MFSSSRARRIWEAELEQRREDEEVMCAWSPLNVAHMKLLNSTFLDVQTDWSPEDRDGFYRPHHSTRRRNSYSTKNHSSKAHHLRSVTPKPKTQFSQAPIPAYRFSPSSSSSTSDSPHRRYDALSETDPSLPWNHPHNSTFAAKRGSRREPSPPAPPRTTGAYQIWSSSSSSLDTDSDDSESDEDPFASPFSRRESFSSYRGRGHARRGSDSMSRSDRGRTGGRGRTTSPCPIGLQQVRSTARRTKMEEIEQVEEWIEVAQ